MAGVAQYDVGGGYHKRIVISDVKNSEFQELTGFPLHTLEGLTRPAGDFFPPTFCTVLGGGQCLMALSLVFYTPRWKLCLPVSK